MGTLATLTVTSLDLAINQTTSPTPSLDFATELDVDRDGVLGDKLKVGAADFAPAVDALSVSAVSVGVNIFNGFVTGSAGFSLTKQAIKVKPDTAAAADATLLYVTLTSPTPTVGAGAFGVPITG